MHPFLDPKTLTDEQILEKLGKAYEYMHYQESLGHVPTVKSIKEVIDALEDERNMRMAKITEEESKKKNPNGLSPIDIGVTDKVDIEEYIRNLL